MFASQPNLAAAARTSSAAGGEQQFRDRGGARPWGVLRAEGRQIVGALYPLD